MTLINRHLRFWIKVSPIRILVAFALFVLCRSTLAQQADNFEFYIERQKLSHAIVQFSDITGIQFFYTDPAVSDIETAGVSGMKTADEALDVMLEDTGYTYEFTNPETIRIYAVQDTLTRRESTPEESVDAGNDSEQLSPRSKIYEIVTTGQRRRSGQNLQDVPISITALSREELEMRNIDNFRDLNEHIPNVSIRGGGTTGRSVGNFVVRGVPGVTRYLDGVAQPSDEGSLFNVLELERIEVLKGPQGTLFGKNAMGGAIHYITQGPRQEFSTRVRATFGSFSRRNLVVNVDVPLTDDFLTKMTAARIMQDGYVHSGVNGVQYGDEDSTILRFQGAWQPAGNIGMEFSIASSRRRPDYPQANVLYDVIDDHPMVQAYNSQGLVFTDQSDAFGKFEQYRNSSLYTGVGDIWDADSFNLNTTWDINEFLSLRTISGYREFEWGNYADLDASRYAFFEIWQFDEVREMSQELQFQGTSARWNWTAGLYFSEVQHLERRVDWKFEEVSSRPANLLSDTERVDKAVFAEGTYDLTGKLTATLGLRYSHEDFSNAFYTPAEPRPPWQQITTNLSRGPLIQANAAEFAATTSRYSLQYDWTEEIMTYITYSEGFNGGGVNNIPVNGEFIPYDGEQLKQYELGIRSDLFGDRLRFNAAYFQGEWEDIQIEEVVVPGTLTTLNAGEAEMKGLDVQILWAATDNLRIDFSAGLLDTEYISVGETATINTDSRLALSPQSSYSLGATYYWTLENGAYVDLHADYGWLDKHVSVSDIRLQDLQDAYGLLNARLVYSSPGDDWSVSLFGTNLTDEWYQLGGFSATLGGVNQGIVARPREIGVSVSLDF